MTNLIYEEVGTTWRLFARIKMEVFILIILIVLFIFQFTKYLWRQPKNGNLMPGPPMVETIRGFYRQGKETHFLFTDWSKIYGPICTCHLGPRRLIILNDYKTIKEAFSNPSLNGRPEMAPGNPFRWPKNGIIRNEGESLKLQRSISLRHLKSFGFGSGGKMEQLIGREVQDLVQHFESHVGIPMHMNRQFFFPALNMIWILFAGLRLTSSPEDKETRQMFLDFVHHVEKITENPIVLFIPSFVDYFPWLPFWKRYTKMSERVLQFVRNLINQHKNKMAEGSHPPTDFIFAYLTENCFDENGDGEKQLEAILMDFIFAGYEGISSQTCWAIFHLMKNPEWQVKVHDEMDSIVQKNCLPSLSNRVNLPQLEACILESQRMTPVAPIGVPHEATTDTTLGQYKINKGTMLISNLYGAMNDPQIVQNPECFDPQRFLGEDKETGRMKIIHHPYLLGFGTGKRFCLGQKVAQDAMFLLMGAILMKFRILNSSKEFKLNASSHTVFWTPMEYHAIFERR